MSVSECTLELNLEEELLKRAVGLRLYIQERIPEKLRAVVAVEDVLQDIWIAAFRRFKDFDDEREFALDRWLRTIANRKLLDALKSARRARRAYDKRACPPIPPDQSRSMQNLLDCFSNQRCATPSG